MSHGNPVLVVRSQPATIVVRAPGTQGPPGQPGAGGLANRELLAIAPNQTTFNLTAIPSQPHLSQLYLNGAKAGYGTDYTINSSTLTWLSAIALESTDSLEIYY